MAEPAPSLVPGEKRGRWPTGLMNPYLQLAINGVLVSAAELLLKRGAMATSQVEAPAWLAWLGVTALGSPWVWAGVVVYIASFLSWLHVLRWLPLSIAFPISSVVHALIPLGCWVFLHEEVRPVRWAGIGVIMLGIWLIANPLAKAEEAL